MLVSALCHILIIKWHLKHSAYGNKVSLVFGNRTSVWEDVLWPVCGKEKNCEIGNDSLTVIAT